jgi:hypothetical protein
MPDGPAKDAAYAEAGFEGMRRAFLGRDYDGASKLVPRDGKGHARLQMIVGADGAARIEFLDEDGKVTKTQTAS